MKLTKEQAIDYSIELWEWLAKTGKQKEEWSRWKEFGEIDCDCFLCEYNGKKCNKAGHRICTKCPYYEAYNYCTTRGAPFEEWMWAGTKRSRKECAKLFLEQLKELKK